MISFPDRAGPTNSLVDVGGLRVGQVTRRDDGWLSGVTVVLAPDGGMTAGVDVRGGGPGTRETDLLDPGASVQRVDAIVLTGGSAYGLASASGVADELGARGIGFAVGPAAHEVVPIVPAAVVFDLGRGGDFHRRPGHAEGVEAVREALRQDRLAPDPVVSGVVGAGTGTRAGGFKGGVGTASAVLDDGSVVAALVVANAMGSIIDQRTGELLAARHLIEGDGRPGVPTAEEVAVHRLTRTEPTLPMTARENTTIAVVATDVALDKAQCARLAGSGQSGLARAVDPVHTLFDGDTIFGVSTGTRPEPAAAGLFAVMTAAAECVTRALARAVLAAETVTTPAGTLASYLDTFPSVRVARP